MIVKILLNIKPVDDALVCRGPEFEVAELLRQLADRIEHTGKVPEAYDLLTDDDEYLGMIVSSNIGEGNH